MLLILGVDLLHIVIARLGVLLVAPIATAVPSLFLFEAGRRVIKDLSLVLRRQNALIDPA